MEVDEVLGDEEALAGGERRLARDVGRKAARAGLRDLYDTEVDQTTGLVNAERFSARAVNRTPLESGQTMSVNADLPKCVRSATP